MRHYLSVAFVAFFFASSYAQAPQKMSYQSVIRDASNELLTETAVGIQVSILQGSVVGDVVFAETHSVMTNVNGLVSLQIGLGSTVSGSFSGIDWGNGPYFVRTDIDPSGGFSYSMSATTELLSVPYALHAATADSISDLNIEGPLHVSMDADDPTSNFPIPWENDGAFVATFENTNTDKGDGIKIKLGKQRTEIIPEITFTQPELDEAQQILDLLNSSTSASEREDILEGLILEGIQEDAETVAGLAVGAGNLITGFINDGLGLPLDVGLAINDEVGLPYNFTDPVNDALDLPWNITAPINSTLGLPLTYHIGDPIDETVTFMPALPDAIIPEIPDASIPGFPESTVISGYEYTCTTATPTSWDDDFEGTSQNSYNAIGGSGTYTAQAGIYSNLIIDPVNPSDSVLLLLDYGGPNTHVIINTPPPFNYSDIDLTDNHTFSLMVYVFGENEGYTDQPMDITMELPGQVYITKPIVQSQWQTVTFNWQEDDVYNYDGELIPDFDPAASLFYPQVRIYFNRSGPAQYGVDILALIDDFSWDGTLLELNEEVVPEGTPCEYTDSLAFISQTFYEQVTDFRIPEIPTIPEFSIGDVTITPIDPRNLTFWGIVNFDFTELNTEALSNENEFIRFSDVDDSKMGSIRAQSKANWAAVNLNPIFLKKVRGITKGTMDKKHMRATLRSMLAEKAWSYSKLGVEYSSSFGDYAEWLERADPDERMRPGSIVGVVSGKISKDLTDAEQVMVVSHNPIVLGNVPKEGSTHLGNNIAFVGQVPVKVMGAVHTGDYIIGNPATPGYGYAKGPEEIGIEELRLAVGRSWEDSTDDGPKMVNTVVGVHNGDCVNILKNQAQRLESLESNMETVLQILSVEANKK